MEPTDLMILDSATLRDLRIPHFVTGSMASTRYGEPRFTHDVDFVAAIRKEHIDGLLTAFPIPEFYISDIAIKEAIARQDQFNILHPDSGLKADLIVKHQAPFDQERYRRAQVVRLDDASEVPFTTAEDVILAKLDFYRIGGSQKHVRDIAGILRVQREAVDRAYIERWAAQLGLLETWREVSSAIGAP